MTNEKLSTFYLDAYGQPAEARDNGIIYFLFHKAE